MLGTRVLDRHLERFGLQMHEGGGPDVSVKCKSIALPFSAGQRTPTPTHFAVNGGWVKFASQALHPGAPLDDQLTGDPETRRETRGCQKVALLTKAHLHVALVVSILTCGAELWGVSAAQMRRLQSFHRECTRAFFRIALRHSWKRRVASESLLKRCKLASTCAIPKKKFLSWLGHVARMEPNRLPKPLTFAWVPPTRPVGRTKSSHLQRALRFVKSTTPVVPPQIANDLERHDGAAPGTACVTRRRRQLAHRRPGPEVLKQIVDARPSPAASRKGTCIADG